VSLFELGVLSTNLIIFPSADDQPIGQVRFPFPAPSAKIFRDRRNLGHLRNAILSTNRWFDHLPEEIEQLYGGIKYRLDSDKVGIWQFPFKDDDEADEEAMKCYLEGCWFANRYLSKCARCKRAR